jgi:hypothetical protein
MMRVVALRELASARAGDKGNVSSISVWAYDERHYPAIKRQLTAERVKAAFPDVFRGKVLRYELDHLHGMNFVLHEALEGGVNASLNLDAHGKSFSYMLLGLDIEIDGR